MKDQKDKIKEFKEKRENELRSKMIIQFYDYCLNFYGVTRKQVEEKEFRARVRLQEMQAMASFIELSQVYMFEGKEIAREIGCSHYYIAYIKYLGEIHRQLSPIYRQRLKKIIAHFETEFI